MQKKIKVGILVLGIIALIIYVDNSRNFLINIHGHKIYKEEYLFYAGQAKSDVYNYFYHKYGVQAGDLEWEKDYGDGKPIDQLINRCNTEVVGNSLVWQIAYQRGITDYYSFKDFKKVWKHEMKRRKNNHATGEIAYGPVEMRLMEYYDYVLSDLKARVIDAVWEEADYKDEQLEAYYETIKSDIYLKDVQIEGIKISSSNIEEEGEVALEAMREVLLNAEDLMQTVEEIQATQTFEITEVAFNDETSRMDMMKQPDLRQSVLQMSVGEVTPIFVNDISKDIIVVTEVEEERYYTFDEMKEAVEQNCKQQQFNNYMAKRIKDTTQEINYDVIKKNIGGN